MEESENKLLNLSKTTFIPTDSTPCTHNQFVGRPSEIAASKIVELSKKLRDQNAEVEGLKSRCKKLETKLKEKENEVEEIENVEPTGHGNQMKIRTIFVFFDKKILP